MQEHLWTRDIAEAAKTAEARLSVIAAALGVRGEPARPAGPNGGQRPFRFTVAEAARIVAVRRLQDLGVRFADAVAAAQAVTDDILRHIIASGEPRWLVLSDSQAAVHDANGMMGLLEGGGGDGLQVVALDCVLRDLFAARLERLNAEAAQAGGPLVEKYTTGGKHETGIYLHRSLKLAVFKNGRGLAIRLDPGSARDLARQLERLADAAEAPPAVEAIN